MVLRNSFSKVVVALFMALLVSVATRLFRLRVSACKLFISTTALDMLSFKSLAFLAFAPSNDFTVIVKSSMSVFCLSIKALHFLSDLVNISFNSCQVRNQSI